MHLEFAKLSNRIPYILLLLCASMMACTKVQTIEDLQAYIKDPDNGLYKEREIGRVKMSVTYRPTDLLVKQSISSNPTDGEIDSLRRDFGKMVYFVLSMSADGREIENFALKGTKLGERIQMLSFRMGEYVRIITDMRDTIPVADCLYLRTYGAGRSSDLLMAFDGKRVRTSEGIKFQVSEFGLGVGDLQFKFHAMDIKNVPFLY